MITKDNIDLPVLKITPENYKVPAGEERFYHVKMEIKSFDHHTGERLSRPFVQKFAAIDFENGMMSTLRQQGYDIVILHNPKDWTKTHAEELAKTRAQKAEEAKAKAEAEKKALKEELRKELLVEMAEAEKKALKEELRKELLAEMAAEKKEKKDNKKKDEAPAPSTDEEPDLS